MAALGLSGFVASPAFAAKSAMKGAEEIVIQRPYGPLVVAVASPAPGKLAEEPLLLLNFSADRMASLPGGRYGSIVRPFLDQGHRVASFDLPAHGDRIEKKYGSGIAGMSASIAAGEDVFALFVEDGRAVIDALIKRGLAKEGRIVLCGVSRGGYCVLRLAAADSRIAAVAGLAPVTDWRELREFAAIKDRPAVAELALTNYAAQLAGRRVYVASGNADTRVGTAACLRFILALSSAEKQLGLTKSFLRFHVVDDSVGHSLATRWRREGIQFLLADAPAPKTANGQGLP